MLKRIDDRSFLQIESMTMSWCTVEEALAYIQQMLTGADDTNDWCRPVQPILQSSKEHGRCQHCA